MTLLKAVAIGSIIFGSALAYAEDGYDRLMNMDDKFRANQEQIHGAKSDEKNLDEFKSQSERRDQSDMQNMNETKAD